MAYYDIALLSADNDFILRTRSCATTEGVVDPVQWTTDHAWQMAAIPTFGDKYAYALNTGVQNPGRQESVISDGEILSAVQYLMNTPAP